MDKTCKNCNNSFNTKDKRTKFCSQSCGAKYHNRKNIKQYYCTVCNVLIANGWEELKNNGSHKYCKQCQPIHSKNLVDWSQVTLKEYAEGKTKTNYHGRLRQLSRDQYRKSDKPKKCCNCGYNKFYEVCHIKPIADFELNATVAEVNHINNLVGLCPNCHWELDNGHLQL